MRTAAQGTDTLGRQKFRQRRESDTNQVPLPIGLRNLPWRQTVPELDHELDALLRGKIARFSLDFGLGQHRFSIPVSFDHVAT